MFSCCRSNITLNRKPGYRITPCVCRVGWHAAEYGAQWGAARSDRRLNHHIRDSAWLKARLCVLAADDKLKQRY